MRIKALTLLFCAGLSLQAKAGASSFANGINTIEDMRLATIKQTPEYIETKELCSDVRRPELTTMDMAAFKEMIQTSWRMHRAYQTLFFSGLRQGYDYSMSVPFFKNMIDQSDEFSSPVKKLFASEGFDIAMKECFNGKLPLEAHAFMLSRLMADVLGQSGNIVLFGTVLKAFNYVRLALISNYGKWTGNLVYSGGIFGLTSFSTYQALRDFDKNLVESLNPQAKTSDERKATDRENLKKMKALLQVQQSAEEPNTDLIERLKRRIAELEAK